MDEYLDFSFQASRFEGICKYKAEKENELYTLVMSIQNNIFNRGTSISDINESIKRAVALLRIINEQRDLMFRIENTINSKVAMRNDKIGTGERIDALTSLEKSRRKYDISDMYARRDLLFRAIRAVKYIKMIRPFEDEDSFDRDLYNEYSDGLAEIDLDLYYRMAASDKTTDLTRFKELHDYRHEYTLEDIDDLSNPIVVSSDTPEDEIEEVDEFDIDFEDEDEEELEDEDDELDMDLDDSSDGDTSTDDEDDEVVEDEEFTITDEIKKEVVDKLTDFAEMLINDTDASEESKSMMILDMSGYINERVEYWQRTVKDEDEFVENIGYFKNGIIKKIVDTLGEPKDGKTLFVDKIMDIKNEELKKIPEDSPLYDMFVEEIDRYVDGTVRILDSYDYENHGEELLDNIRTYLAGISHSYLERLSLMEDIAASKGEPAEEEEDEVITPGDYEEKPEEEEVEEEPSFERFPFGGVDRGEATIEEEPPYEAIVVPDEEEEEETFVISNETKEAAFERLMDYADKMIAKSSISDEEREFVRRMIEKDVRTGLDHFQKASLNEIEFEEDVQMLEGAITENINTKLGFKNEEPVEAVTDVEAEEIPEDVEEPKEEVVDAEAEEIPEDVEEQVVEDAHEDISPIEIKRGGKVNQSEGRMYYMIFEQMINAYGAPSKENFDSCVEAMADIDDKLHYDGEEDKYYKLHRDETGYYVVEYENDKEVSAFEISWDRFKRFTEYKRDENAIKIREYKIEQREPAKGHKLFTTNVDGYMMFDAETQMYILRLSFGKKLDDLQSGKFKMTTTNGEPIREINIPLYGPNGEPYTVQLLQDELDKEKKM